MTTFVIGLNHKTAPIEVREKLFLSALQQDLLLSELKNHAEVGEAFVLSTCNRTEVYLRALEKTLDVPRLLDMICRVKKMTVEPRWQSHFYVYEDRDVLRHLLHVVTGLDSLVLGEQQILGQVKSAFERARQSGLLFKYFNVLSQIAIRTGKKAQNETQIICGGSSVSWAAISLAEKVLGSLKDKSVLVIGAGKMSELAVGHISNKGFSELFLMNRTLANAQPLAKKYRGTAVSFYDLKDTLGRVDVCICSTDAPHYILEAEALEDILSSRARRDLLFIDISMPRNIDPDIGRLSGVRLFHIDDLERAIEENRKKRLEAVADVKKIIEIKLTEFERKWEKIPSLSYS